MKAAIFIILFVLVQACYSQDFPSEMLESFERCITKLHHDRDAIIEANKQILMDEDDENMIKFFECHSQDMGMIDSEGQFVFDKLTRVTELRLKLLWKNIVDSESKAHRIASLAVENCKNSPLHSRLGIQAIKMRNCLRSYVANTDLLD